MGGGRPAAGVLMVVSGGGDGSGRRSVREAERVDSQSPRTVVRVPPGSQSTERGAWLGRGMGDRVLLPRLKFPAMRPRWGPGQDGGRRWATWPWPPPSCPARRMAPLRWGPATLPVPLPTDDDGREEGASVPRVLLDSLHVCHRPGAHRLQQCWPPEDGDQSHGGSAGRDADASRISQSYPGESRWPRAPRLGKVWGRRPRVACGRPAGS